MEIMRKWRKWRELQLPSVASDQGVSYNSGAAEATNNMDSEQSTNKRYQCYGCGRLMWLKYFPNEITAKLKLGNNNYKVCKINSIPWMGRRDSYAHQPKTINLPGIDPLIERLIPPRIPTTLHQEERIAYSNKLGL